MCVDLVRTVGTICGHLDASVCKAWLVECCCLSVACQSWLSHLCICDRCVMKCMQFVIILWACGCTCLQCLVCLLLLLVVKADVLCFICVCLWSNCVQLVCTVCTCCAHADAHACTAWSVDCCCLSVVCHSWRFHLVHL